MPEESPSARQAETRRLAAIMFTDIVGFSRQMGSDEARMLRLLDLHNRLIRYAVSDYHGHVIKTMGDAFLVDFPSAVQAVQCAQAIQAQFHHHNAEQDTAEQIHVRIGIHLGDIVHKEGDVFGDGVNTAARLQTLAEPDTVCLSHKVYEEVAKKLPLGTVVSLGRPKLKNLAERFEVYALLSEPPTGLRQALQARRLKLKPWRRPLQVLAVVLTLGLVSVGALVLKDHYLSSSSGLPLPDKPSLVVLPFVNMSDDPQQDYFSDGITEDLTADLSQLSGLFVIARNSAFTYKSKAVKMQEVSKDLGVRYALEGSVRRAEDRVRITAQLIDATTGLHLWAERYDRPLQDIFALQDEIRQKIVTALKVSLLPDEQARFRHFPTTNLEAYDFLLRGWETYWQDTRETNAQARHLFEQALALDPRYAGAYAGVSATYLKEWSLQWSQDRQTLEHAFTTAQKALALDETLPLAYIVLASAYQNKNQHDLAIAAAERAIALNPNDATAYIALAELMGLAGRPEEGIAMAKTAMRLNPHCPPWYLLRLGMAYHQAWHNEEAIATLKRFVVYYPNALNAHIGLACSYSDAGREEEARAEATEVMRLSPNFTTEVWRQNQAWRDAAEMERHLSNLRKAGLT